MLVLAVWIPEICLLLYKQETGTTAKKNMVVSNMLKCHGLHPAAITQWFLKFGCAP